MTIRLHVFLRYIAILLLSVILNQSAYADKWQLAPVLENRETKFGDIVFILEYDTRKSSTKPNYTTRVYNNSTLLSEYKDVGYSQIFASPYNRYFVALSNEGLVDQAYVIFDQNGAIIKQVKHNLKSIHYCKASITLVREWYDSTKPEVDFHVEAGELVGLTLRGCDGSPVKIYP